MKNLRIKTPFVVVVLAAGLLLGACKDSKQGSPPSAAGPVEVGAVTLSSQMVNLSVELPGRTAAFRIAEVRPQVSGIVLQRLFTEGSEVKAGKLLYQINPATYQAAFDSAKAALARIEAMEYSARLKANRYRLLVRTKAVSDQEQIEVEAGWKQSVAEVAAARAALENARINLDYTKITAPISGRIGKSLISEGALVTAQQATALAIIQQLDPLYIDVSQSSNDLLQLKKKLAAQGPQTDAQATTDVKVLLPNNSEYSEIGILEFSDVTVDQSTGTVTMRATVANPRHELLPGMFVRARLTKKQEQQAILVPQASIVRNNRGEALVMLINDKSEVEARPVQTGQNLGDKIVITEGLHDGERLIVEGLQKIKPGVPVSVAARQPGVQAQAAPVAQTPAKKAE